MGVKIRQKGKKLYLDIYVKGARRWEALHLTLTQDKAQNKEIKRLAEMCRAKREMQVVSGEWGLLDPVRNKQTLFAYMSKSASEQEGPTSNKKCLAYLREYPGGESIQIGQVTAQWVEDFQKHLQSKLKKSSAQLYAVALRHVLGKAVRDNIILKNPSLEVASIKSVSRKRVHLNPEEVAALARTPLAGELGAEMRRAFLFACLVGLRVSAIKRLKWGDIEMKPLQIIKQQEKTREVVSIPLNASAWALIKDGALHNQTELVFPLFGGQGSTRNDIIEKWARVAGLEKHVTWHVARHTFAVQALESGAEIYTVSRLLGHTDVKTTQVYANITDKTKRAAVDALPKIKLA